jgi:hypothetical protein
MHYNIWARVSAKKYYFRENFSTSLIFSRLILCPIAGEYSARGTGRGAAGRAGARAKGTRPRRVRGVAQRLAGRLGYAVSSFGFALGAHHAFPLGKNMVNSVLFNAPIDPLCFCHAVSFLSLLLLPLSLFLSSLSLSLSLSFSLICSAQAHAKSCRRL